MLSIEVLIRKAKLKDIPGIIPMWKELIGCHRKKFRYAAPLFAYKKNAELITRGFLKKNIRSRNCLVLVAEDREGLVGYAIAGIGKLPTVYLHDREVHLGDIYIRSGYRKKGIGTMFVSEIAAWGRKKKILSIGLTCNVLNKAAFKSYRKMGFEEHHFRMSKIIHS